MRRLITITAALAVTVAVFTAAGASAQGGSPAQLEKAGWDCPFVLGAIHCAPPGGLGRVLSGEAETMSFLVFHEDMFLGTEHIVRADLFSGQPCPTDPPSGKYTYLGPLLGLDYYACHRYDSSF
jgi:hypothetical protein